MRRREKGGPCISIANGFVFRIPTLVLCIERLRVVGGQCSGWRRQDRRYEQPIYEHPVDEVASRKEIFSK